MKITRTEQHCNVFQLEEALWKFRLLGPSLAIDWKAPESAFSSQPHRRIVDKLEDDSEQFNFDHIRTLPRKNLRQTVVSNPQILSVMDLRGQLPTLAPVSAKIRLSILSTAVVDALGFPNEFTKRFMVDFLSEMKTNPLFRFVPAGSWTDDTSMMLCLAQSISSVGGFSGADQMKRYERWRTEGYLSSVDFCFDIGVQIGRAIGIFSSFQEGDHVRAFRQIRTELGGEMNSGNGSLMRILPIGLVCWRNVDEGKAWARKCSQTTHPNTICVEACQLWTCLIMKILAEMDRLQQTSNAEEETTTLSKLYLLDEINKFPFTDRKLRDALTVPEGVGPQPLDREGLEMWYCQHHPLLRLIASTQTPMASASRDPSFPYTLPPVQSLSSSGYVLNTIVAALYCFFATKTFEEGALMAVNLCDDADTVGAVYAGLAGCWYAGEKGSEIAERLFWSERVTRWMEALKKRELVEQVAEDLVVYESTKSS